MEPFAWYIWTWFLIDGCLLLFQGVLQDYSRFSCHVGGITIFGPNPVPL